MDDKSIIKYIETEKPNIDELYDFVRSIKSDLQHHCLTLKEYGEKCNFITEFGVRWGKSTICFLASKPLKLTSYDIHPKPSIPAIQSVANFDFKNESSLETEIEETDLLFIDTYHVYNQLIQELRLHHKKIKKYIIMHDTQTFGRKSQDKTQPGLMDAIEEFIAESDWKIEKHFKESNGLTILSKA